MEDLSSDQDLEDLSFTLGLEDPSSDQNMEDLSSDQDLEDLSFTLGLEDPSSDPDLDDLSSDPDLEDPSFTLGLEDPSLILGLENTSLNLGLEDPSSDQNLEDLSPTLVLEDPSSDQVLEDLFFTMVLEDVSSGQELEDLSSTQGPVLPSHQCAVGPRLSPDLEHVRVGVLRVLHDDRVAPGQRVGDAVLALVAKRLLAERRHQPGHMAADRPPTGGGSAASHL